MKTSINLLVSLGLLTLITSCENPIHMETKIHEDGKLDKTIIIAKTDSTKILSNMFGISEAKGWNLKVSIDTAMEKKEKYKLEFQKSFASAEEANQELDQESDTLFRVHARFDKRFRWFYTYLRYEETIRPIDRFKLVAAQDYFTTEDKAFIDRLPGEGVDISKGDSAFLESLTDRIFKSYGNAGLYHEQMDIIKRYIQKNNLAPQWLDSLHKYENVVFKSIKDDESDKGDPKFAFLMADSLRIPLTNTAEQEFDELSKNLNQRIRFMSFAQYGRYTIVFDMPWTVTNTNADSVAGNKLFWRPIVTKFAIQDYTLVAESRKLNVWAVIVSAALIIITAFIFWKRKSFV